MHFKRRLLALIILLALTTCEAGAESFFDWIFGPSETSEASDSVSDEDSGIEASTLTDDGLLRVMLRSLDAPQALNITLAGIYTIEGDRGFRFDRDAAIELTLQEGEVWLHVGGLSLDMGPALTLTRQLDGWGEAGGLYIQESEKPNLYMGDLSVSAGERGLVIVLTIHVEDYLKGVVAYEMSDSFPLESLKAQAVAARTYALQRKWSAGNREYDLVDTTADQVFKGYDPTYENVIRAVEDTRGVVGTWSGAFATCYYTASNGGQTALASQIMGDEAADSYLSMREDPYDLENPRSLENDLTFTDQCEGSIKLRQMLEAALQPVMADEGYEEGTWAFDAIKAIEPINPRWEGSWLYDDLAFDLAVRVSESRQNTPDPSASPTPTGEMAEAPVPEKWVLSEETRRVVIPVFDDIKEGLSLGLNGADCELISVEQAESVDGGTAFKLIMRRYGHGVGMSQRGAQNMAGAHDMSYVEILNFYYPGMTLERMTWPEANAEAIDESAPAVGAARPRPTPLPTPAPLPELQPGERLATVTANMLNLRERPTTLSKVVEILDMGRQIIVSGDPDPEGWVSVHTAESEGYVKVEYLDIEGETADDGD